MQTAIIMAMVLAGGWAAKAAPAQDSQAAQSAERIYNERMQDPYWKEESTGERFAWHAVYGMSGFLEGYEATGNTVFLDWGVKYYDAIVAKLAVGPDGYKGWIGPYDYSTNYWCDCHVGDALLFAGILDLGSAVLRHPELKAKYGAKVQQYVKLAKRDFFDKWDARGTWREEGPYGVYVQWDKYGLPGQYKNWTTNTDAGCAAHSNMTVPFNMQIETGLVALRIWQITGEEKYKQRAEKIFGFMKSRMQRYRNGYHWNYWEPAGQWDLVAGKQLTRHWVGTHPERNYQSGEVALIMKAYNGGIVFTEEDIRSIVNTNLKMMWNGDVSKPLFANSNADLKGALTPTAYAGTHAGELWAALTQVDGVARQIYAGQMAREGAGDRYFRNVTAKMPPSYQRRDVRGPVEIPQVYARFPLGNVRKVNMAAALPGIFASGEKTVLICKLIETGNLEVALYSPDGERKLATLHHGQQKGSADGLEGILYFAFDGRDPSSGKAFPPGDYRVRWTVAGDGYREYPITIKRAKQ